MKKYALFVVLASSLSLLCLLGFTKTAKAQSADICASAQYSTTIKVPVGAYDIYLRNSPNVNMQEVRLAAQTLDSSACTVLPKLVTAGTDFTKVATYTHTSEDVFALYAQSVGTNDAALSTLELYFVPIAAAPCELMVKNCTLTYQGTEMELSPKKLSYSSDNLRAGLLTSIDNQTVKRVVYAVDGKKVYEKDVLEPFDKRYVSGGEYTTTRKVIFANGQTLTRSEVIKRGTSADILYTFQAFYFRSSELFKIIAFILAIIIILAILRSIVRYTAKKRLYVQTHTAGVGWTISPSKVGAQKNFYDESIPRVLYRYRKIWGSFLMICVIILASSYYLVSVFTVDGVSMYPTLQDRSKKILVRAPRTIASIARNDYIPKRGTIVVVNKSDDNVFTEELAVVEENYVVKRVVGLPGDRVVVKDGIIRIYNTEKPEGFVPDDEYKWINDLAGSEYFRIDITLKDGEVFVVGDNRDESIDSRFYGAVDSTKIVGSVL